jgi:serine/threonine protein kinase
VKNALPKNALQEEGTDLLIEFLEKCLVLDPQKRMTASEALSHPFLQMLH